MDKEKQKEFLENLDEQDIEALKKMIDYYRASKVSFWVVIGLGMLAGAATGMVVLIKSLHILK